MAIVSVFGRYAKGLKKTGITADVSGVIRQSNILLSSATDQEGNKTVEGYQAANAHLESYSNDPRVALQILDNDNALRSLVANIIDAQNDVTLFQAALSDSLDDVADRHKGDPVGMIFATSDVYLEAADLYNENVLTTVIGRLDAGQKIPNEVLSFANDLDEKSTAYALVANSFAIPDIVTGEVGPEVPEGYGFVIQSNPATGKVSGMWFQPVNSLSPVPAGYNRTDSTVGDTGIPIYLPTVQEGNEIFSRLGDRVFRSERRAAETPEEVSTRTLKQQDIGFNIFGIGAGERQISLGSLSFDRFDIPVNTVLRDGAGNFSYLDNKNIVHAVDDIEALIKMVGDKAVIQAYRVNRTYINEKSIFERGDAINSDNFERFSKEFGGGALSPDLTAPQPQADTGELPAVTGQREPRSLLGGARETAATRKGPGATARFGAEVSKGVQETEAKILGGAREFFGNVKEGRFLNP